MWTRGDAGGCHSLLSAIGHRRSAFSVLQRDGTKVTAEAFYLFSLTHSTNPIWCKRKTRALAIFGFITDNNKSMMQWVKGHFPKLKVLFPHGLNNHSTKLILGPVSQGRGAHVKYGYTGIRQWTLTSWSFQSTKGGNAQQLKSQHNPNLPLTGQTGGDLRSKRPRLQLGKCRAWEKGSSVNTGRQCAQPEQGFRNQADIAVFLLVNPCSVIQ